MENKFDPELLRQCTQEINEVFLKYHEKLKLEKAGECAEFDVTATTYVAAALVLALSELTKFKQDIILASFMGQVSHILELKDIDELLKKGAH